MKKFAGKIIPFGLFVCAAFLFAEEPPQKYWVFFKDKPAAHLNKTAWQNIAKEAISERALKRRAKVRARANLIDKHDLPVGESYLLALKNLGYEPLVISNWLNAASFRLRDDQVREVAKLPFVAEVKKVAGAFYRPQPVEAPAPRLSQKPGAHTLDYGLSFTQNNLINIPAVHDLGITGKGVWIGLLDSGFKHRGHEVFEHLDLIAERDFINNDDVTENEEGQDTPSQHNHGTQTLSTVAGFKEGQLIGAAFGASFLLAKTEIIPVEIPQEEDNWVAGIEWLESQGVDVVSSSLGYIDFYTPEQMDGNTAVTTRAADLAVSRGVVVVNSAGNERSNPNWRIIIAPADGDSVIAVGAVNSSGSLAAFSSGGPTADGRIKPDVVAMGVSVFTALPLTEGFPSSYAFANGTSFSCPLTAGVAALILSTHPHLTPMEVRDALRQAADRANNPDNDFGWGLVDAYQAVLFHGPAFSNSPATTVDFSQNLHVSIKVASKFGVPPAGVTLIYSLTGDGFEQSLIMSPGAEAHQFTATIPAPAGADTVQFYFTVVDSAGQTTRQPVSESFTFAGSGVAINPGDFHLFQNYPNPFNPTTTIFYDLPTASEVTLAIFNILGQRVRTLVNQQTQRAGRNHAVWDGKNDDGELVSTGLYFYTLRSGNFAQTRKMILIH